MVGHTAECGGFIFWIARANGVFHNIDAPAEIKKTQYGL